MTTRARLPNAWPKSDVYKRQVQGGATGDYDLLHGLWVLGCWFWIVGCWQVWHGGEIVGLHQQPATVLYACSSGVTVFRASAWIAPPIRSPSVASVSYTHLDVYKRQQYRVIGKENMTVAGKPVLATKVAQSSGNKQTIVWIAPGIPTPLRIVQREDGSESFRLQLKSWR